MSLALAPVPSSLHVPHPAWRLWYARKDVTVHISPAVLSITYTSKLEQHASEIDVTVEDRDRHWQTRPPVRGDRLQLSIGYDDAPLSPCGLFEVDEFELTGPPDVFHMKGIGAAITPDLRTHRSRAYEGQSLLEVATSIAQAHGYTVVGAPSEPNVVLARITQKHETDLAFLRRLANLYGYSFSPQGQQLVFAAREHLEQAATVTTIDRPACTHFAFTSRTHGVYKSATVSYSDPATKQVVSATAVADPPVPTGDELKVPIRAEGPDDAHIKAKSLLHGKNKDQTKGKVTTVGAVMLMAGLNATCRGWGAFDGKYHIESSVHRLNRGGGYSCDVDMFQVPS
jgi:phage protein D